MKVYILFLSIFFIINILHHFKLTLNNNVLYSIFKIRFVNVNKCLTSVYFFEIQGVVNFICSYQLLLPIYSYCIRSFAKLIQNSKLKPGILKHD